MNQNKEYDVLVVGELNVDLIFDKLNNLPVLGKEIFANEMILTLGSSSAILANNLSVLGTKVGFVGKLGTDSNAELILSALKKSGVSTEEIIIDRDQQTGITVAFSYGNSRAMVTYAGAMSKLVQEEISDETLLKGKHLHISSIFLQEGLLPGIVDLYKRAKALGLTTSLDTQWDPYEKWNVNLNDLLPNVDIFLPNEEELKNMTNSKSFEQAIKKIKDFANIIVVKRATEGAELFSKTKHLHRDALLNANVIDTIGAGDSFNAGFLHKYIQHASLEECMENGVLMGSVNTYGKGGTGAFISHENVAKLSEKILRN